MVPQELSVHDDSNLSRNEKFLRKVKEIVELNLHNEQFGVEELAREIAINRAHLYRKINKLTGKTISQFIREVRLERAKELLIQDAASIAEIAYQVGFSSPTYFNKCFHDTYGFPPGEISKLKQKEGLGLINPNRRPELRKIKINYSRVLGIDICRKSLQWIVLFIPLIIILATITIYFVKGRLSIAYSTEKTIAVLPFHNESPDPENEYFCNGMVEEIITNLQGIKDIRVKSCSSIENYRNTGKDMKKIARELAVSYILEGDVMKAWDHLRINVKLVNGKTGNYLWAGTYDGTYSEDIFNFQQDIAFQIAEALDAIITPEEKQKIATPPTADVTAYDYLLKAREEQWKYWQFQDTLAEKNAENLCEKALRLDPNYALGWIKKGSIYYDRHINLQREYYEENYLDSVFYFYDKAAHLDPKSNTFLVRAMIYHRRGDIKRSIHYYKRAIETLEKIDDYNNPDLWESMWRLGQIYIYNKEFQNGFSLFRRSVQYSRVSLKDYGYLLYRFGNAYLWIGDDQKAEKYYIQSKDMGHWFLPFCYSDFNRGNFQTALNCSMYCNQATSEELCNYLLGNIHFQLQVFENAVKYFELFREGREARKLIQWDNLYREGIALVELGHKEEGMKLIEKQLALLNQRKELGRTDGYDYHLAAIYAYLGDYDKVLQHLKDYSQKVFFPDDHKIMPFSFIQYDILFDPMRNNPEFKALLKQDRDEKAMARALIRQMENTAIE